MLTLHEQHQITFGLHVFEEIFPNCEAVQESLSVVSLNYALHKNP